MNSPTIRNHIRLFSFRPAYFVSGTIEEINTYLDYIYKLYIMQIRIYLFFCFTEKVLSTKTEKFDVGQGFSETWIHMEGEVIYIFCSYVYGLYTLVFTSMMGDHNNSCHQKYSFCLFILLKSICLEYVHYGPKSKAIILHDWCDILGLYCAYSCTW